MDQNQSFKPEGAPACAQTADAGAPSGGAGPERRFSAQRKLAVVTRLLRGEPLETVALVPPSASSLCRGRDLAKALLRHRRARPYLIRTPMCRITLRKEGGS